MFIGRTDAEAETPVLWPPHAKSWLIGKDPDAGKDWGREEKGTTEDEMVGWHHRLNGHVFGWTLGVGDGQGGLACCSSWGRKMSDTTEQLNWTELNWIPVVSLDLPCSLLRVLRCYIVIWPWPSFFLSSWSGHTNLPCFSGHHKQYCLSYLLTFHILL